MAVRYIPYFPDTLEGQALLDNFVRTKRHRARNALLRNRSP